MLTGGRQDGVHDSQDVLRPGPPSVDATDEVPETLAVPRDHDHSPVEDATVVRPEDVQDSITEGAGAGPPPVSEHAPELESQIPQSADDPLSFLPARSRSGRPIRRNPKYGP